MAKVASGQNPSLSLHQVLEEEFQRLHGYAPEPDPSAVEPEAKLRAVWAAVHQLEEKQAALCISGGGIRSATFALGVLQGLARCGLLRKFHYLSTVSGGGYIGGWLTAWIHNSDNGIDEVISELAQSRTERRPNPEPEQIQNLRSYSNYLSPRLGIFSADTWTLVGTYLRNLLLNWLVLIPLLMAALTIPWIYTAVLMQPHPPYTSVPLWTGGVFIAIGVGYMGLNLPAGGNRRWNQKRFLLFCLAPLFLGAILMTIHWAWFRNYGGKTPAWSIEMRGMPEKQTWPAFVLLGLVLHLISWAGSLLRAHGFRLMEVLAVIATGAIGGALLWLGALKLFEQPLERAELYSCLAVPLFLALFFLSIMAFAGISSRWTGDPDREWWGRATGWLLAVASGWLLISGLVLFGPLLFSQTVSMISTISVGSIAGLITVFAGRNSHVPANEKQATKASPMAGLLAKVSSIAALLFIAVLMILLIRITTGIMEYVAPKLGVLWNLDTVSWVVGRTVPYLNVILYTPTWLIVSVTAALIVFGLALAYLINPNRFSLHAMYRDRLIRAYLGASNKKRDPNPFTGFDERDNKAMLNLWRYEKFEGRLLPVVNIALNLVGGSKLAWQERKAASFTISPFHCGSYEVGYRKTDAPAKQRYGGEISLGTAMTISGAAASPNMGYHSSPLVTFILTLLNVRLGAWLGNPGKAGDKTFHLSYPKFSVHPLIAEAFGLTNETNPYVYLSDGGHFENLGLYEMVLRRCHYIVVSDAGEDPSCSFADLGGAVRKIRIDLGISIDFDEITIYPRGAIEAQNMKGRNAAVGRIRYSEVDGEDAPDGIIVYLKPACYGNEPRDIYEYFKSNDTFPHESTGDQFFTESQFESYRMLGVHTMEQLCRTNAGNFSDFIRAIFGNHLGTTVPEWLENAFEAEAPKPAP